ncbi:putative thiosulfate sulfurtransferase, mitochondrial [Anoplophora glabripennis]|uniref:putative thiosulfate sulfurtransferase, mitochondrial n=1 Tax=Anoplophora glabripennis TaxID=217634 RepID=UPI000C761A9B|nr:putative thiosulfate sulfurtransferase, mitochondrial [Anoplophora glabripennis]
MFVIFPSFLVNDLENVLTKVSANDFKKTYGRKKPDKNFNIIFSCKSGRRAHLAQEKAISLGYKSVSRYLGSWLDWEKHTKLSA